MSPTEEQQDWVDRNLLGGAKAQKQKSVGLVAFKNELAADQFGQQGLSKDFEVICSLFTRLPTIIEGAANIESLSNVFQVSTAGSGSDDGLTQGGLPRSLISLLRWFRRPSRA